MIQTGGLARVPAGPAAAEGPALLAGFARFGDDLGGSPGGPLQPAGRHDDSCGVQALDRDHAGPPVPEVQTDPMWFRGSAPGRVTNRDRLPVRLEIAVRIRRGVVQTGTSQKARLSAAQPRANPIDADLAVRRGEASCLPLPDRLRSGVPVENRIAAPAPVRNADLALIRAMRVPPAGLAVTATGPSIRWDRLSAGSVRLAPGPTVLLIEAGMATPAAAGRAKRAGVGLARLAGCAATGLPDSPKDAGPVFENRIRDRGRTHADAP